MWSQSEKCRHIGEFVDFLNSEYCCEGEAGIKTMKLPLAFLASDMATCIRCITHLY